MHDSRWRPHSKSLASGGFGLIAFAVSFLGVPRMIALLIDIRTTPRDQAEARTTLRKGIWNRPTGRAKVTKARFGRELDIGIDNEGDLDADDTKFE